MRKKWIITCLGLSLLLQACVSNDHAVQKEEVVGISDQLLQAVEQEDLDTVKKLITEENIDLNIQDAEGRTPLMIATYNNDVAMAKVLIEAGADVNIQDNRKNNPFLYAGAEGYME